jgi:hypothetical protein
MNYVLVLYCNIYEPTLQNSLQYVDKVLSKAAATQSATYAMFATRTEKYLLILTM